MKQPPQSAKSVLETLKLAYPEMPVALQKAARHIIDNPREVGVVSMRSLAVTLSVHPNAFVRLARHIGFDGYDELRERFRDFVRANDLDSFRDRALWLQEMAAEGDSAAIFGGMTDSHGSPLALVADHSLVCPTHTPQFFQSNAAVISLLETLTALLVARGGEQARGRIENFHDRRFAAGVYDEEVSRIREPHG